MKVVACYKCVPNSESIEVSKNRTLDMSNAQWEIGEYDLRAVEEGLLITKDHGGELIALTAAGEIADNSKMRKAILSRGPQEMFAVKDMALENADATATASALKAAVEKIGGVDLVLCGEGSGDIYAQRVGVILGGMLGWNTLNAVCEINVDGDALKVKRMLEDGIEEYEVSLPAVLMVSSNINSPHIPTMRAIMGAGKKPSTIWCSEDVGVSIDSKTETISVLAPETTERKQFILEGNSDQILDEFVSHIKKAL